MVTIIDKRTINKQNTNLNSADCSPSCRHSKVVAACKLSVSCWSVRPLMSVISLDFSPAFNPAARSDAACLQSFQIYINFWMSSMLQCWLFTFLNQTRIQSRHSHQLLKHTHPHHAENGTKFLRRSFQFVYIYILFTGEKSRDFKKNCWCSLNTRALNRPKFSSIPFV